MGLACGETGCGYFAVEVGQASSGVFELLKHRMAGGWMAGAAFADWLHRPGRGRRAARRAAGGRRRWGAAAVRGVERLEQRVCLAATVWSFGAELDVVGVGLQEDGDRVLVGNRLNASSGFSEGVVFEIDPVNGAVVESVLGSFGEETFVTAVSPNGQYVTGTSFYTDGTPGSGYLVDLADPGVLTATGGLGPVPESFGFDVSNSGTVVGTTHGLGVPYSWSASAGIVGLTPPNGGGARGISETGVIVGSVTTGINEFAAAIFENGTQTLLSTKEGVNSIANDVSPNGEYVGGSISFEDLTLFKTVTQAVVWVDGRLSRLQNSDGTLFDGKVAGVSDNGYAVGEDSDGHGFIWHASFAGVRRFDEWLLTEHETTLPTAVNIVTDVLFDGEELHFAANGGGYLISAKIADASPFPYHNKSLRYDVNGDGTVAPLDVLIVINALNRVGGSYELPASRPIRDAFLDVNRDGHVSPIDALQTINQLNRVNVPTARIFDLGAGVELLGATKLDNGNSLLAGNRLNPTTGFSEGFVFHINTSTGAVTEALVGSFGENTTLTSISPNGVYLSGYSRVAPGTPFEGFRAEVANPLVLSGTGGLGEIPESFAADVSNDGVVVGTTHGLLVAYRWEPSTGIVALTEPNGGGAGGISNAGVIAGTAITGPVQFNATLWQGGNQEFLETPEGVSSAAADISPNGEYIGGAVTFFEDLALFEFVDQAAVWFNGELTRLEDADGNIFQGVVRGVSDNGFAVGHSSDGRGFIWHESFGGVRLFDEWLLTEFGITVPTPVAVVWDVYFDGSHLNFAVSGLNALIRTTVPSSNAPAAEGEAPASARDAFFENFDPQELESD